MKLASLVPYAIGAASLAAVVTAFSGSASPYVTVAEARSMSGDRLHLGGDIMPNTLRQNLRRGTMEFDLKDGKGEIVHVVHKGERVSLAGANKLAAIGKLEGKEFVSHDLLVKCPSKYEEKKP